MTSRINKIFEVRYVEYIPTSEKMEHGVMYVSRMFQTAVHLCACGCGCQSVTPFGSIHGWEFKSKGTKVSLSPSILNTNCPNRAHYFVRDNKIVWT